MGNNPLRNVHPLGNSWWDVLAATVISVIDNTIPGSNLRAQYQPTDPSDYNAALKSADLTMLAVGTFMLEDGTRNVGGGAVLLAVGGAGAPLVVTGAAEIALGAYITVNATLNIAKGYHYGEKSSNSSTEKKNDTPVENQDKATQSTPSKVEKSIKTETVGGKYTKLQKLG